MKAGDIEKNARILPVNGRRIRKAAPEKGDTTENLIKSVEIL